MVTHHASSGSSRGGSYTVEQPRATDDLSGPLRKAFGRDAGVPTELPTDMAQLLAKLSYLK
ncbi:hypothetical protein [Sphingomonas sp. CCH9-F2]|jgi:hypothetical protein|uniref:Uncharacterized protein n=1 Tax=Sphingomonas ginsenosidimutans TaxID=862134 RepID=A0A2A4I2K6_9SPHN|nr:hypothetical protein [Sphingomonas sp. CCH9-F2]MEE2917025.1 hypothetical protein [Pseudomonadota bacterium]PCG10483.1 hypothetical protein COA17_03430 [Sphingomonas ginsenosidimutans]